MLLLKATVADFTKAFDEYRKANAIAAFWIAYILTRPLGASCADLLTQPAANGGLGLGTMVTSVLFLVSITCMVMYLTSNRKKL